MSLRIGLGLGISQGGEGVGAANAFSAIKKKIADGAADVVIVIAGDSTSVTTSMWPYLAFADIAALHPTHTFEYYPPNGSGGFGAVETLSTGSGSRKVKIKNASVSGEIIQFAQGGMRATTFAETPDLIIWNFGKNHTSGIVAATYPIVWGEFLAAFAEMQVAFPSAHQCLIKQFPNRDDSGMAVMDSLYQLLPTLYPELKLVDLYTPAYVSGDYLDNLHMTTTANTTKLKPVFVAAWTGAGFSAFAPATPFYDTKVTNQLDGDSVNYSTRSQVYGDFNNSAAGTSVPSQWSTGGSPTFADEASIVIAPRTKSVKMLGTGSQPRILRAPTTARRTAMLGQNVFLMVRQRIDTGGDATVGRIGISYNSPSVSGGATQTLLSRSTAKGQGDYKFTAVGPLALPADATNTFVTLYHDADSTADTEPVYLQEAVYSISSVPRGSL